MEETFLMRLQSNSDISAFDIKISMIGSKYSWSIDTEINDADYKVYPILIPQILREFLLPRHMYR